MALLELTPPEKATGKLAELYASTEAFIGAVPGNVRLLGVSPDILENQLNYVQYNMTHPTLSRPLQAMIRMLVSRACKSPYCEAFNKSFLKQGGLSDEQIEATISNPANAPLEDKEKELLGFVLKVCEAPHSATQEDIDKLKTAGWTERDIFDAVNHGARSVAANIVFDAFKLEPDL